VLLRSDIDSEGSVVSAGVIDRTVTGLNPAIVSDHNDYYDLPRN
jgi:hypothetical protein